MIVYEYKVVRGLKSEISCWLREFVRVKTVIELEIKISMMREKY